MISKKNNDMFFFPLFAKNCKLREKDPQTFRPGRRNWDPLTWKGITYPPSLLHWRSKIRLETGLVSVITVLIHIAFVDR